MSNNNWFLSKTKIAGILGGVSIMLPSMIAWLNGDVISFEEIIQGFAIILGVFGIRDALDWE